MTGLVVAIDGPAGSGKSTVARALAKELGLDYLDTGAMYRSVAFAAIRRGVDPTDPEPVAALARDLSIEIGDTVTVDGVDATIEIRGPEVTRAVSTVAANPEVRAELRARQRAWIEAHGGGVVEGRDIGTVVWPEAELKAFLTAADDERARRRHAEVSALHYDANSPGLAVEAVQADLARRDHADSTRAASPLAIADDAVLVDTTGRPVEDIVQQLLDELRARTDTPASATPAPAPPAEHPRRAGRSAGPDAHGVWRPPPKGRLGQAFDRGFYAVARGAVEVFAKGYWRLTVEGQEHLPPTGSYIVAPVHRSNIDTPLVGTITRRRLRFMGKDSLWKHPVSARIFSALGGFPVHRGSADRDALRRCMEVIDGGEPLVMFPEGTRQSGPAVQELFEGAAYVATRTGVPIVPVGIGGSEYAMPKGAKMLRRVRIAIVVGAPIEVPPAADRRGSRRATKELTERLHGEVQRLFDEAQRRAGVQP